MNNENLDDSRMIFFKELKERVKGMGMKDAIPVGTFWNPTCGRGKNGVVAIRTVKVMMSPSSG